MRNEVEERNTEHRAFGPERGATATEYAILMGFIALAIVFGIAAFGLSLGDYFTTVSLQLRAALS
jgi:pilus assembly protein Flp/PilA